MSRASERIGEYRLLGELARTPACITYDAAHVVLPRRALIKVMTAPTERLALRALREPFFLETLQQHPGVPRVFESSMLPDRRPWFARERVDAPTLAARLTVGSVERAEVIAVVRDVADILAHAHQRGVIHCGLRPDRVMLTERGRGFPVCIAEWSEARAHDAAPVAYVPSPGTWHYTAPEIVVGEQADDRADVFSLGVMTYQLLTGTLPFERGAIAMRDATRTHVPTEVRCPDAPRELTGMVDQMLAIDRWDRPTAAEIRADLTWLADVLSSAQLRMRRPRWTPQLPWAHPEDYDELEIADGDDVERS